MQKTGERFWMCRVDYKAQVGTTLEEEEVEAGNKLEEISSFLSHTLKIRGFSFPVG